MDLDREVTDFIPRTESETQASIVIQGSGAVALEAVTVDEDLVVASESLFSGDAENPLGMYLNGISKIPLLTREDEVRLARQIKIGQELAGIEEPTREQQRELKKAEIAKDTFVRSNLRLVVSIARRHPHPPGMELLDLIQEGNMALQRAVEMFEHEKGFKFSTYATWWIRQAISRAMDQKGSLIHVPEDKAVGLRMAMRTVYTRKDAYNLSSENQELRNMTTPASLDKVIQESDTTLGELVPAHEHFNPVNTIIEQVNSELLVELLSTLDMRAKYAVMARFGLEDGEYKSNTEIGDHLGLSAEAVGRLISRSIAQLREDAPSFFDDTIEGLVVRKERIPPRKSYARR